jgi:hypothetical protein
MMALSVISEISTSRGIIGPEALRAVRRVAVSSLRGVAIARSRGWWVVAAPIVGVAVAVVARPIP